MPHDALHCRDCRTALADHGTRCKACAERRRQRGAALRKQRRAAGLCLLCEQPAEPKRSHCRRHLQYHADRWWRKNRNSTLPTETRARAAIEFYGSMNAAAKALGCSWGTLKRAIDPAYSERCRHENLKRARERLKDPEKRKRINTAKRDRARARYATDPGHREKIKQRSREHAQKRLAEDPGYRDRQRDYNRAYYKRRRRGKPEPS